MLDFVPACRAFCSTFPEQEVVNGTIKIASKAGIIQKIEIEKTRCDFLHRVFSISVPLAWSADLVFIQMTDYTMVLHGNGPNRFDCGTFVYHGGTPLMEVASRGRVHR